MPRILLNLTFAHGILHYVDIGDVKTLEREMSSEVDQNKINNKHFLVCHLGAEEVAEAEQEEGNIGQQSGGVRCQVSGVR